MVVVQDETRRRVQGRALEQVNLCKDELKNQASGEWSVFLAKEHVEKNAVR